MKEQTTAEIIKELEERAKKIEAAGTFKGESNGIACILMAGLEMLRK